jgi:outer membrane protein TolC
VQAQDAFEAPASGTPTPPPAPVIAPQVLAEPEVSVDELVQRARANSPQLPIARRTLEAARERLGAARSLASPTLELVPRIVGNREAADSEVILSQPLDVFGQRRAQANVARAEVRRAEAESTLAERSLVVQVKNAAADLFAAQEAESLGSVQVEVAQLFRDAAARRAELGDVPPVQVQRAELELLRVQNELTNAQAERLARRAALNQLVGQPPETPLRVAFLFAPGLSDLLSARPGATTGATTSPGPAAPGNALGGASTSGGSLLGSSAQVGSNLVGLRAQVLPGALVSRPDVVSAQATLETRQAQVRVLRRSQRPNIELQARRSAFFGESGSTALRAVVTVPLFDFGANKRERRALEAEVGAQQATIDLLRSQVATQVEQALIRLEQQQADRCALPHRHRAAYARPLAQDPDRLCAGSKYLPRST